MHKMKFIEYQKEFLNDIFNLMALDTRMDNYPNLKKIITASDSGTLNLMYITHSGNKFISPFLKLLLLDDVATDKADRTEKIINVLLVKYGYNWDKMCEAFYTEYEPLYNYNMLEHEEVNSKVTNKSGSKAKVYGFNTVADAPVGDNDVEMENEASGSKDDNFRDLSRKGNIGVTTSQQMLESELELRKYNILDSIFNDIDKVICLKIY